MQRYVKLYENVLDKETCDEMIKVFEANKDQHEVHKNEIMNFKQINLIDHITTWKPYVDKLTQCFSNALQQYQEECSIHTPIMWPEEYAFEQFRLKRYEPNEGIFDTHVDVRDYNSAIRFLVFFLYLNDAESGDRDDGATEFPTLGLMSPRKAGSILMFPPLWTYPHAGLMPKSNPKYIVGSYLHYLKDEKDVKSK